MLKFLCKVVNTHSFGTSIEKNCWAFCNAVWPNHFCWALLRPTSFTLSKLVFLTEKCCHSMFEANAEFARHFFLSKSRA